MRQWLVLVAMLASANTWGATYYIDYTGGVNTNNGTSPATAWEVHPYMKGFNGSYTHHAGDRFIFRGGVTWPNSVFAMGVTSGGTSGNPDYYGVDKTWYAGNTWTKPVFDAQATVINDRCFISVSAGFITIDNFEMTGFYWDAVHQGYGTCLIGIGVQQHVIIKNCYFHNWNHASYESGCRDDLQVILANTNGTGIGDVIDSCIFDGAPNGSTSGAICYTFPTIRNSIIKNLSNGPLVFGLNGEVSGCTIGPINDSFDPACHENGIEDLGIKNRLAIFNNIIHNTVGVTLFVGGFNDTIYIYNNVIYNSQPVPILLETRGGSGIAYIYNNTISSVQSTQPYPCIDGGSGTWTYLDVRNNHFISEPWTGIVVSGTFGTKIEDHNLTMTEAEAGAAGYTLANLYRPTALTSPTVDAGVSLAGIFADDLNYVARPQDTGWDVGAYEYQAMPICDFRFAIGPAPSLIIPNPIKAALLYRYLQARQEVTVCDLAGNNVEINRLSRPGIYMVKEEPGKPFQTVFMIP